MHPLLDRLLRKRKIEHLAELSAEEKNKYDEWERILSEGEISVQKVASFCRAQLSLIEAQWKDFANGTSKNDRLIVMHTTYRTLLDVLSAPAAEKEALERYLTAQIEQS